MNDIEDQLAEIAAPVVADLGYSLVQVKISGVGRATNVQIMAEDIKTGRLPIDACALISRMLSPVLDVADLISSAYRLEVTSPGIDRPLVAADDFVRFAGLDCKIESKEPLANGQKRFSGKLQGLDSGDVVIKTDTGLVAIPLQNIHKAKLVLTDELIAATKNGWPPQANTEDTSEESDVPEEKTTTGSKV